MMQCLKNKFPSNFSTNLLVKLFLYRDFRINNDFVLLFEKRERSILNIPGLKVKI